MSQQPPDHPLEEPAAPLQGAAASQEENDDSARDADAPEPDGRPAGLLAKLRQRLGETRREDRNVYPLY